MNCDNIKIMVCEYIDGELPKGKEAILFTHLSGCSECRDEFKQQNLIKHEVQIHQREVTDKLEKRVFETIKSKRKTFAQKFITRQSPVYFNYMLGGIIIIIALLSFFQIGSLRADLDDFKGKYSLSLGEQNELMQKINSLLINQSPVKVRAVVNEL
jgi:predicted anti-sigma-YlaC factor YlaD